MRNFVKCDRLFLEDPDIRDVIADDPVESYLLPLQHSGAKIYQRSDIDESRS